MINKKIKDLLAKNNKSFSFLIIILTIVILTTLIMSYISFDATYKKLNLSMNDWCLTSKCIIEFSENFNGTLKILEFGAGAISITVVVLGFTVALNSYLISVKSTSLTSHVSNLNLFKNYLESEMSKFGLLNSSKIDIFIWYKAAFPKSSQGNISVSEYYESLVLNIITSIESTNESISTPKGGYGYRKHQDRMIESLKPLGINISYLPKNDFIKIEEQILALIDSVNRTFTDLNIRLSETKRSYI
ncbi:retron Ec48 family effector membrane protein [Shewanella algae]